MSVKIKRSKDDETIVDTIYIDGELPTEEQLLDITQIRTLSIENIEDAQSLQQFLSNLPISTIRRIIIISCNMQECGLAFFEKLQSVNNIFIRESQGIDYNGILIVLPNKEQVETVYFWGNKQDKNYIDSQLLEKFKSLKLIGLKNFLEMNMEEFHSYLLGAENLEELIIEGDIKSLDFISGIDVENITIIDKNLELRLIAPEIARAHKKIDLTTSNGHIVTNTSMSEKGLVVSEKIHIDNVEELEEILQNKDLLRDLSEISIEVSHIGVITPKKLCKIKELIRINSITVMDIECNKDTEMFEYSLEQYEILYNRVQEIVGDIPENFTDLQKFMIIYKRLGSTIIYDYPAYETIEALKEGSCIEYDEEHIRNAGNLINGLIKGTCVCAGYSDILYNCLQAVGIEACKIEGKDHAWNKVKLDGVWYNVDLTWDCKEITKHNARRLRYCLRSNTEFQYEHKQIIGRKVQCDTDYPRKEVVKAMRFAERFDDKALAAEAPSFFDRLKARAMKLFGRRKMIEKPQDGVPIVQTEVERRKAWAEKSGIVLENGEEISRIDSEQLTATTVPKRNGEHEQ